MKSFVHLHLHTQYSLLDGAIKIPQLIAQTKAFEMPAVAMTDHGNLFGAIKFYMEAKKQEIKPIIGCEVYMAPGSRLSRQLPRVSGGIEDPFHHLTLLCMDKTGYKNLCKLITISNFEGFYYKPRLDKEVLSQYNEGLIALSGCLSGEIAQAILNGQEQKGIDLIQWYQQFFSDRFYLEIQENGIEDQKKVNQHLLRYASRFNISVVGTNDCHYLRQEDSAAQEVLLCVQTGKTLRDEQRMKFSTEEFYFKSPEMMHALFSYSPQAIDSTLEIAERCDLDFELNKIYLPQFELSSQISLEEELKKQAVEGLERHLNSIKDKVNNFNDLNKKYEERLKTELSIIDKTGFSGYFLIVSDFVNYAKRQGIPVGPGRGSAAGSLVAFCLNITGIDPIPHNLIFERFLNPERVSMPDMDIDFCMNRRDEVIRYVTEKYGKDNVAQIITFGKMQAKAAIRDVGRVYGFPYGEVDRIAKLVPLVLDITLTEAIEQEPRLKELYAQDERVKQLLNTALALEGLYRHASIHAAGIVISNRPLIEYMPLFRGKEGEVVTSFDMKHVEKIGLIKFDFLGLKTLTLIECVVKKIKKTLNPQFEIDRIDFNDKNVFNLFSKGDTLGVFQFESSGMRDLLIKLKPARMDDIIAANALFRPGPMGRLDDFIDRRHNRVKVRYPLAQLEDILQDSYGIIIYQEQVMKIANVLANYSLGEADILRKAMGKKISKEMEKQKKRFLRGALQNKIQPATAEKIFELMAKFAKYGFNKSHATAYAYIAYQTAYLKVYYRLLFMAEMLTIEMENTDKMARYIQDLREDGVDILPPDIHESDYGFSVVGEKIRFGLGAIKNVGQIAIEAIIEARKKVGRFYSLAHFCEHADLRKVNRKVIESLIKGGGFDSIHPNRAELMESLDQKIEVAQSMQADREIGQYNMFSIDNFTRTKALKQSMTNGPIVSEIPEWPEKKKLRFEKESIGLYLSGHPLKDCMDQLAQLTTHHTENMLKANHRQEVRIGGVVSSLRETVTKRGDKMAFVMMEDLKGNVDVIVFSDLYMKSVDLLKSEEPLLVTGMIELTPENAKIIATNIEYLAEAQKAKTSCVHIDLDFVDLKFDQLQQLKFILSEHRGACPVLLHLKVSEEKAIVDTVMRLSENIRVIASTSLAKDVDALFQRKVVRFE